MTRQPGWEQRLLALVESARAKPYRLGLHDCAIFAASAIEALTGSHPIALAGAYASRAAALRFQRQFGASLSAAVTAVLGIPPVGVRMARRGDLLLYVDAAEVQHLGVCLDHRGVLLLEAGLQFPALAHFSGAWRIG